MKNFIPAFVVIIGMLYFSGIPKIYAQAETRTEVSDQTQAVDQEVESDPITSVAANIHDDSHEHHEIAPFWLVIPFVALLLMIATGPLFYEHFWHHNYPKIAVGLALFVVFYYLFILHNVHGPVHALAEYVQFIALLASLYIASGGILIEVDKKATPMANVTLLVIGAIISNLIGTTGASMLLIRPFIRLNKGNIQAYHIIFFILKYQVQTFYFLLTISYYQIYIHVLN